MKPVGAIVVYFLVIFGGGALLAPWLYWLAQWGAEQWPAFSGLAKQPFHRYVNRCWMVLAVIGLWPFLKSIGISSWRDVGLRPNGRVFPRLGLGFLIGLISLAVVAALALWFEARTWRTGRDIFEYSRHFANAGLAAIVVGFLEEIFFRGALFGALRKAMHWVAALTISSAIYALVHFFQRPEPPGEVGWATGLALLPRMLRGFADVEQLVPGFFNLTLAGIILGVACQRGRDLYLAIGLHAGWIFWFKSYKFLTRDAEGANVWFWGSSKLIDGWMSLLVLAGVLALVWRLPMRDNSQSIPDANQSQKPAG